MTKKSVFGLDENVVSMLCYVLGFISGIAILVMERENKTVRFHALQSTLWFMLLSVARVVAGWIPLLGGMINSVLWLVVVLSALFLMYNAYMGKKFKIPLIGDTADTQINR